MSATIYALASGAGRAGLAVIRVSGPQAGDALRALTGRPLPPPRQAARRRFSDPTTGLALDDGLALWFPGPGSYTGEDVAELHGHGGPAVIEALLGALARLPFGRLAEPGEFTRRAVLAGKMDLTEAEGLIDLIEAETEAQRRQALRQAGGALRALYDGWRERLIPALAYLEAAIDFPDEEGVPEDVAGRARPILEDLIGEMSVHLADDGRGERLRRGLSIAILGAPNAGKSSLLNRLARRDAAIVSDRAGTTRDVIEVRFDLDGIPALLADTAGLREAKDGIEAEGVRRARAVAAEADLRVLVLDGADPDGLVGVDLVGDDTLVVRNKADLPQAEWDAPEGGLGRVAVSTVTGAGVEALLAALSAAAARRAGVGEAPLLTRARHREAVGEARACLRRALDVPLAELAGEETRLAARALGRITGRVEVEELLDVVFRDFCVGK